MVTPVLGYVSPPHGHLLLQRIKHLPQPLEFSLEHRLAHVFGLHGGHCNHQGTMGLNCCEELKHTLVACDVQRRVPRCHECYCRSDLSDFTLEGLKEFIEAYFTSECLRLLDSVLIDTEAENPYIRFFCIMLVIFTVFSEVLGTEIIGQFCYIPGNWDR